jgi:hypothetical protein
MTAKFLNPIEISEMLRSDPATGWESIVVQSAEWISPSSMQGIDWLKSWHDLSARLPGHIRERLRLGGFMDSPSAACIACIATAERAAGKPLNALRTPDEIKTALGALPGPWTPDLLISLWRKGRLKQEHLRVTLLNVWRYLDHPAAWPMRTWRAIFRCAGFLSDGEPRPTRALTVYRGCTPEGRRGMSWGTQRWVAEKFANYWVDQGYSTVRGHVYKARVNPGNLLAMIPGEKTLVPKMKFIDGEIIRQPDELIEILVKPEFEIIVDARSLRITLVETAKALYAREVREGVRTEDASAP